MTLEQREASKQKISRQNRAREKGQYAPLLKTKNTNLTKVIIADLSEKKRYLIKGGYNNIAWIYDNEDFELEQLIQDKKEIKTYHTYLNHKKQVR